MSLSSVLQTAYSGVSAATVAVDAVSQNMANSRTNGYKSIRPVYATQTTSSRGGGNPLHIGMGVQVTGFVTDNSQGPLVVSSNLLGGDDGDSADTLIELSNTDVGAELVELILASGQFSANANVFDTAGDLLDELINLGRSS
jgi:flagellar hook protein FlgE